MQHKNSTFHSHSFLHEMASKSGAGTVGLRGTAARGGRGAGRRAEAH